MDTDTVRRQLLRGSLAAPLVLTVSSPSVAASSFNRCLANLEGQQPSEFFAATADGWYRAQVPVVQLWAQGQTQGYFFLDQVTNLYVNVVAPYKSLSFGQILDPGWKITEQSTRWALVWFDKETTTQYSKITLQRPSDSLAATVSCCASFTK